jgi:hypothetical protein
MEGDLQLDTEMMAIGFFYLRTSKSNLGACNLASINKSRYDERNFVPAQK